MFNAIVKNWKTTLLGAISAGIGAIGAATGSMTLKESLSLFAVAALGVIAKDFNTTGGDNHQ